MIKLYTNRELAQTFKLNLAKWKRWSREFLLPDPLAGMQSGFARQYYIHDVFTVYLGGHLVADLKYSIVEAKQILQDLKAWLGEKGFHPNLKGVSHRPKGVDRLVEFYSIFIIKDNGTGFSYRVRGGISSRQVVQDGFRVQEERYVETWVALKGRDDESADIDIDMAKVLNITGVLERFKKQIDTY
jgi:hypothetical protein